MEKKIKLDSKTTIKLDNNVGWLFVYKDQFGRDIVPTLVPALNAGIDLVFGVFKSTGGTVTKEALLAMDTDAIKDALIEAAGLESTDLLNITWAMAKNADEDIDTPREWVKRFDPFPFDIIGPAVFEMLYKGLVSTKNSKRLQSLLGKLKPTSTESSSQEAEED